MPTNSRFQCAVLVAVVLCVCAQAQQADYVVSERLRLTAAANGINGVLEVRTDSRLTSELQKEMWGVGDWSFVLAEDDPRYAGFKAMPPSNAELRIVTDANQVVQSVRLDQPLARVSEAHVIGDTTTFLVAVDYSIGFGSYAGVTTQFLDVNDGQFRWAESTTAQAHNSERIRLPETLKSAWKLVPFNRNKDILWTYCRPAKVQVAGHEFVVGYVRYRYDGQQWVKYERLRNGFWESDQPFPPLSRPIVAFVVVKSP